MGKQIASRAETDEEKKAVLQRIFNIWIAYPHLRLGQLIENAIDLNRLYYMEDDELVKNLEKAAAAWWAVKTPR